MIHQLMNRAGSLYYLDEFHDVNSRNFVLFHGYGADAQDLFSLKDMVPSSQPYNWYFPNGFIEVPIGPGWTGRAWWNLDLEAIQAMAQGSSTRNLESEKPQGLPKANQLAKEFLKGAKIELSHSIIGGFSQGAMLATDVVLNSTASPRALVILSGALIQKEIWQSLMKAKSPLKIFQSHGTRDPILPYANAQRLNQELLAAGHEVEFISFNGGHEIPPQVLRSLGQFLALLK